MLARFRGSQLLPKTPSPFPKTIGVLQGDRTCGQRPTGEPVSSGGVSQVIGGGNTSALHPAFMFNQIWRSRVVLPPEPELKELVHEIAAATKSQQLLQQMLEELRGLRQDFDEDRAERALAGGSLLRRSQILAREQSRVVHLHRPALHDLCASTRAVW
jgi:hypothetical protein